MLLGGWFWPRVDLGNHTVGERETHEDKSIFWLHNTLIFHWSKTVVHVCARMHVPEVGTRSLLWLLSTIDAVQGLSHYTESLLIHLDWLASDLRIPLSLFSTNVGFCEFWGMELRSSCFQSKHFTKWTVSPAFHVEYFKFVYEYTSNNVWGTWF